MQREPKGVVGRDRYRLMGMPLPAIAFLMLSAVIEVVRARVQLLGMDEYGFGLLGLARNHPFSWLAHIQLTNPVSFDPIGYNALIYAVIHYFGTGAITMRLPSMVGYLVMQVCLFWVVSRIANEWAGTVALALPALMGVVNYSVEARPYAVMLGCAGMALVCWQAAERRSARRPLALAGMAVALALAVNMQYYAVLLFVPICAAEAMRIVQTRRADVPMLGAIAGGLTGLILVVPFAKALSTFKENHNNLRGANIHFVAHSYTWLLLGDDTLSVEQQHAVGFGFIVLVLVLVAIFVKTHNEIKLWLPRPETVLLGCLAALPVFALLLAITVTHFVEPRYISPTMIGVAAVMAILLSPLSRHRILGTTITVALFVLIVVVGAERVNMDRQSAREYLSSMEISPEVQRAMDATPGQPIYVINHFVYEFLHYYSPSAQIRSRLTLVYLEPDDFGRDGVGADVNHQMANMEADGVSLVTSYEALDKPGTERLFLLYHAPWDWTDRMLPAAHAEMQPLGEFFKGDLEKVRFP